MKLALSEIEIAPLWIRIDSVRWSELVPSEVGISAVRGWNKCRQGFVLAPLWVVIGSGRCFDSMCILAYSETILITKHFSFHRLGQLIYLGDA